MNIIKGFHLTNILNYDRTSITHNIEKKKDGLKRRKNLIFKQTYYEIKIKLYVTINSHSPWAIP